MNNLRINFYPIEKADRILYQSSYFTWNRYFSNNLPTFIRYRLSYFNWNRYFSNNLPTSILYRSSYFNRYFSNNFPTSIRYRSFHLKLIFRSIPFTKEKVEDQVQDHWIRINFNPNYRNPVLAARFNEISSKLTNLRDIQSTITYLCKPLPSSLLLQHFIHIYISERRGSASTRESTQFCDVVEPRRYLIHSPFDLPPPIFHRRFQRTDISSFHRILSRKISFQQFFPPTSFEYISHLLRRYF